MGFANVFWINEAPIRNYLAANGKVDEIATQIGEAVLDLTASYNILFSDRNNSRDLLNIPDVINSVGLFHSTNLDVLLWTGNRVIRYPHFSSQEYQCFIKLDKLTASSNYVPSLSSRQRRAAIRRYKKSLSYTYDNPLKTTGEFSIYWVYEDFTRDYKDVPKAKWPSKAVGDAILQLMLDVWQSSMTFLNYVNVISKAGSFLKAEFGVFVWVENCLSKISEIYEEDKQKIIGWLDSKNS